MIQGENKQLVIEFCSLLLDFLTRGDKRRLIDGGRMLDYGFSCYSLCDRPDFVVCISSVDSKVICFDIFFNERQFMAGKEQLTLQNLFNLETGVYGMLKGDYDPVE